jgi:hypothetical protein
MGRQDSHGLASAPDMLVRPHPIYGHMRSDTGAMMTPEPQRAPDEQSERGGGVRAHEDRDPPAQAACPAPWPCGHLYGMDSRVSAVAVGTRGPIRRCGVRGVPTRCTSARGSG